MSDKNRVAARNLFGTRFNGYKRLAVGASFVVVLQEKKTATLHRMGFEPMVPLLSPML